MRISSIDAHLTKQHFSVKIYKSYIDYVSKHYPNINVSEVCQSAGLPLEYLNQDDGWVSIEFNFKFMEKLKEKIQDPYFARKVGESSFSKKTMGPVYFLMKHLLSLEEIFSNIWKFPKFFNKILDYKGTKTGKGRVSINVKSLLSDLSKSELDFLEKSMPDIIENSIGFYSGFSKAKGLGKTSVKTTKVNELEYQIEVRYPIEAPKTLRQALASLFIFLVSFFFADLVLDNILSSVLISGIFTLIISFGKIRIFNKILLEAANSAEETLVKLDNQYKTLVDTKIQLQRRLQEAEAINQITKSLIQSSSEDDILQQSVNELTGTLQFDRVLLMLQSNDGNFLEVRAHSMSDSNVTDQIRRFKLPTKIDTDDPQKITNVYRTGNPILIPDVKEIFDKLNKESQQILLTTKSKSFIAAAIESSTKKHGVLIVDTLVSDRKLTPEDLNIVKLAGHQIALALEKNKAQSEAVSAYMDLEMQAQSFSRFVPFEMIKLLGFNTVTDIDQQAGKEIDLAIVFCDIRGFTSLSEVMNPSETMAFLNSYFSHLAPIFHKHGGIIDKFLGDGIMALFQNIDGAFNAAADFQKSLEEYNEVHRSGGLRMPIKAGMGIHFGKVLLGAVGYRDRLSISVVSDAVNLTSRLDGLTKKFSVDIVASEDAYLRATDKSNFRKIAELSVEGRQSKTKIYEYFGHLKQESRLERFSKAQAIESLINGKGPTAFDESNSEDPVVKYYLSKANKQAS